MSDAMKRDSDHIPDRWRHIIQRVASGENWRVAARAEGCSDSYSRVIRTRMKRNPAVAKAIAEIREAGMKAAVYDLTKAMDEAAEVIVFAKDKGNAMAYCKAVELRAKLSGLLIERVEVVSVDLLEALHAAEARVLNGVDASTMAAPGPTHWQPRIAGDGVEETGQADGQLNSSTLKPKPSGSA